MASLSKSDERPPGRGAPKRQNNATNHAEKSVPSPVPSPTTYGAWRPAVDMAATEK